MLGAGKTVVPIAADTSLCIPFAFSYSEKGFSFLYLKLAPNNEIKVKARMRAYGPTIPEGSKGT